MRIAAGFALSFGGAVLCVACYQSIDLSEDTGPSNHNESFEAGSSGDCSSRSSSTTVTTATMFDGVDILVSVDNSSSMAEAQQLLSTGLITLVNALTRPLLNDPNWAYIQPGLENVRLAVVSSDLGLSYGEHRDTDESPKDVTSCEEKLGDNGAFQKIPSSAAYVDIADGAIRCEKENGGTGGQCPADFTCSDIDASQIGVCRAPGGATAVRCPSLNDEWADTVPEAFNSDLGVQAACMAQLGTQGCGFEQQLEAAVLGLDRHWNFIVDTHVLAVLVVSDENDCSIEDPGLFSTAEFKTPELQNTACNVNPENESNLFSTGRYLKKFIEMKQGRSDAVVFGAVVGVPTNEESLINGWSLCEGSGADIAECLSNNPAMTTIPIEVEDLGGNKYVHFAPACFRVDATSGKRITEARPGRRFVSVAEDFQYNSLVYSICNPDWSPAMLGIAKSIIELVNTPRCFP